jgi:hypothetical protein
MSVVAAEVVKKIKNFGHEERLSEVKSVDFTMDFTSRSLS